MRYFTALICLLCVTPLWAQITSTASINLSLPTVALLDVAPSSSGITMTLTAPTEAGSPVTVGSSNSTKWLNFSSAVESGGSRYVTAHLSAGAVPAGVTLQLATSSYSGSGAGALGSGGATITLSGIPQTVVSGVGGAYTGDGANNGYNLSYALQIQNYGQLKHDLSATLTVTFTFVDL